MLDICGKFINILMHVYITDNYERYIIINNEILIYHYIITNIIIDR